MRIGNFSIIFLAYWIVDGVFAYTTMDSMERERKRNEEWIRFQLHLHVLKLNVQSSTFTTIYNID